MDDVYLTDYDPARPAIYTDRKAYTVAKAAYVEEVMATAPRTAADRGRRSVQ